ncbi:hypothetical protein P691DRAFT_767567 [Macrolepiota fuliginosa MF-IS2]|uniref:Uncharacterized protein n=1 Tax=Macrolepiota fuliginosa MF-IS2 TaxID=1400762 RepID=A0A9P5WYA9_9AGAR|nr:hypothetical protein P691DRAFT_767567 [Macrolepiota fuliginosa MF-IS2]
MIQNTSPGLQVPQLSQNPSQNPQHPPGPQPNPPNPPNPLNPPNPPNPNPLPMVQPQTTKPKIEAMQAIEHLKYWIQQQIFLTTQTPDSYVAWQQDIANLINNFQKHKLCNSPSKSQTPISFYGNALNDQRKKFVYQE